MTKRLITSALPYSSATKHLGNLCSSLLPADVHARFLRQQGEEVLFVCGTDDHGTPAELAAEAAGVSVAGFCAAQHEAHAALYARYDLAFDWFGRTSSARNHELVREVILDLHRNGFLEERTVSQFYSVADGRFLPDRYVTGTCPHCGSARARGDQCEACTRLLDPEDLVDPRSAISGSADLERRDARHLYLRQDLLADRLRAWVDGSRGWSRLAVSIARKWLDEGIEARCVTRDLDWGIPVPLPGFEGKRAYVWFDAPLGYVSIVREWADAAPGRDWTEWWSRSADVEYVQFVGKDSVPFHAVTFPATLFGAGSDIRTVDRLKAYNWLTFEGGKFSTGEGRGVFLDQALELLPSDVWRWWLTANAPEGDDADFSFDRLAAVTNSDLAGTFGNLANRCLRFGRSRFGGVRPHADLVAETAPGLVAELRERLAEIEAAHRDLESRKAASATRALWAFANARVSNHAPWEPGLAPEASAARFTVALNLLRACAAAAWPIVPKAAGEVLRALGEDTDLPAWPKAEDVLDTSRAGKAFSVPDILFPRVPEESVAAWRERFAGG